MPLKPGAAISIEEMNQLARSSESYVLSLRSIRLPLHLGDEIDTGADDGMDRRIFANLLSNSSRVWIRKATAVSRARCGSGGIRTSERKPVPSSAADTFCA